MVGRVAGGVAFITGTRCASAQKPICWTRPGGYRRFSSPTEAMPPGRSVRVAGDPGPSTSTGPAGGSAATVKRFNEFAKHLDPGFGRGQWAYNHCFGDPGYRAETPRWVRSIGRRSS